MSEPKTTDLVTRLRADRSGQTVDVACSLDDLCLEAADEIERLRKALIPFANVARSRTVRDALSFGKAAPRLRLTRDQFSQSEGIDPWAFAEALKLT